MKVTTHNIIRNTRQYKRKHSNSGGKYIYSSTVLVQSSVSRFLAAGRNVDAVLNLSLRPAIRG